MGVDTRLTLAQTEQYKTLFCRAALGGARLHAIIRPHEIRGSSEEINQFFLAWTRALDMRDASR